MRISRGKLAIGAPYVALPFPFELVLGRLVGKRPRERLAAGYDLSRGGLLGLGLVVMFLAPWFAARRQRLV